MKKLSLEEYGIKITKEDNLYKINLPRCCDCLTEPSRKLFKLCCSDEFNIRQKRYNSFREAVVRVNLLLIYYGLDMIY